MSLYDDIDTDKKSDSVAGWGSGGGSGIKFLQTHMQLKKGSQAKREQARKTASSHHLTPVVDFKLKSAAAKDDEGNVDESGLPVSKPTPFILPYSVSISSKRGGGGGRHNRLSSYLSVDPDWQFENEYDPMFPNDYDKALKELRDRRDREAEEEEAKRKVEVESEDKEDPEGSSSLSSMLAVSQSFSSSSSRDKGVAIAPPPSLNIGYDDDAPQAFSSSPQGGFGGRKGFGSGGGGGGGGFGGFGAGAAAAAKIMAKYGYKEGEGLGRLGQGMSKALQVEKTSLRTGRIIHEKDVPKEGVVNLLGTPPNLAASYMDDDEFEVEPQQRQVAGEMQTEGSQITEQVTTASQEAAAEEQLRNPSKVLLLTNMVGPGEVDDDLEPEVKEECQKYGEVIAVIVFQMPDVDKEDSIRIFVEFSQVGSCVKAFMDLNGRFFGGRQVRASFYNPEKFNNLELTL